MMQTVIKGAAIVLCAAAMLGCATHQEQASEDGAKTEKQADKGKVKVPSVPASIFQGYSVTGISPQ